MALDVNAIRSFLVMSPRPAKILVACSNGEEKEMTAPKGVGGVTWASLARSIETLDPSKVELFDAEDKLLRATRFDHISTSPDAELPAVLARDAESARVALFAKHIADAYRFSVETAFTKLVEMFERLDRRPELIEARLERTETANRRIMQERIEDAFAEAEEAAAQATAQQTDPAAAFMQSFIGGAMQGASAAKKPPPNGKADP